MKTERFRLGLIMILLVPVGFLVKFTVPGVLGWWCHRYGAAILYEVFWVIFVRFAFRRLSPFFCAAIVLLVTCALETLQLWHPGWLDAARSTFWGAAMLGTTFDPWDFAYCVVGSILGGFIVFAVAQRESADGQM
jgi:hypothetical protein